MNKPSAIMGTFADVQSIRTRSVAVLKIEVPIEKMDEALLALGGWPQPGSEKAVAVALLVQDAKPVKEPPNEMTVALRRWQAKDRYANISEMEKARTRSALLCKDKAFQLFMDADGEAAARTMLCARIGILSRAAIGTDPDAFHRFMDIEEAFRAEQQAAGYSPAVTGVQT